MVWLWIGLALYGLVLVGASWISVFPPRVPVFFSPGLLRVPQEDVEFHTEDGIRLRGWWLPAAGAKTVAILAHGYLMNRSELSPLAIRLWEKGMNSLVFDLRAHGKSGGRRSGFGVAEAADIEAAIRFVRDRYPEAKVVLIGSSMGAVASALACGRRRESADALILDCAYSRLWVATLGWWRFVGGRFLQVVFAPTLIVGMAFSGCNPFRVDVARALKGAGEIPVLLLHGDSDTLAPPSEAVRNQAACQGPTQLVWLAGQGHAEGRWNLPETYMEAIETFLFEHGFLAQRERLTMPAADSPYP